ncbi:colicin E1 family microcin immunity protein [Enterobacter cloacae]|uniref:colicin E1 family microcin immunity protein n=1 Tax=Enterobacter cloacae TaxID=550 RepID=UPI00404236D8
MTLKYYLGNFYWGLVLFGIIAFVWHDEPQTTTMKTFLGLALLSGLIFPFAKRAIERIALKYSTTEQWTTGFYTETPMKNGLYAVYFMLIFVAAIPVGVIYLLYLAVSKKAT